MSYFDSNILGPVSRPFSVVDQEADFNAILDENFQTDEYYQSPESLVENDALAPKNEMVRALLTFRN